MVGNARIAGGHVTIAPRGGIGKAIVAAGTCKCPDGSGAICWSTRIRCASMARSAAMHASLRARSSSGRTPKSAASSTIAVREPAKIDRHAVISGGVVRNEVD